MSYPMSCGSTHYGKILFETKFTTRSIMVSVSWQTHLTSVFGKHISPWHEWRGYELDLVDLGPENMIV
jgi:hypothetical protein